MNTHTNITKIVLIGLLIGAIFGLLYVVVLPPFPVISDFADYDYIGTLIAEHGIYSPVSIQHIIYPPLYPFFLALFYILFGHVYQVVYIAQCALTGIISALCYYLIRQHGKVRLPLSLLVASAIFFWPYMILYSIVISSEILFIIFLIISTILLLKFIESPKLKIALLLGATFGLATLTRPVVLLLPLWIIIGSYILYKLHWLPDLTRKHFQYGAYSLLAWAVVLLPWIISVGISFNMWMPVASNLSFVFEKANRTLSYLPTPTAQISPEQIITAKLHNIYLFWNPGATGYHIERLLAYYPPARYAIIAYQVGFIAMLLLALVSLRWSKNNYFITYFAIIILYFWALHTVLFPFPRYTLPIIPLTLLLATYSLNQSVLYYAKRS